jgi:GTPase SAR1 family protein
MENCQGYILVCDCTNPDSFKDLTVFYDQIVERHLKSPQPDVVSAYHNTSSPIPPVVFVITKVDLLSERKVWRDQMEELSARCCPLYETSAKNSVNVEIPFCDVLCKITSREDNKKVRNPEGSSCVLC